MEILMMNSSYIINDLTRDKYVTKVIQLNILIMGVPRILNAQLSIQRAKVLEFNENRQDGI